MAVATVGLLTVLAGCGSTAAPDPAVAVSSCADDQSEAAQTPVLVATATMAEPRPALSTQVKALLDTDGRRDDGCVLLVDPDGGSRALSLTPHRADGEIEQGTDREGMRVRTLAEVTDELGELAASVPGLATEGALAAAVQAHPTPGILIVVSSGVSTVEPVDLRRLGWAADGLTLGLFLRRVGWLDLAGWDVRFVGLGAVTGSQPRLPDPVRAQLSRFWLGICRGAGARACMDAGAVPNPQAPSGHAPVPPVPPPSGPEFAVGSPPGTAASITLSTSALFARDSAALSAGADATLAGVVARIRSQDLILSVVGHTDAETGTPAHNRSLSLARARAVQDRLIQLGVDPARIVAVTGAGPDGYSVREERRDPALVTLHRSVVLLFSTRPPTR